MATQQSALLRTVFLHVPQSDRPRATGTILEYLKSSNDPKDLEHATSLLEDFPSDDMRAELLEHLQSSIECGRLVADSRLQIQGQDLERDLLHTLSQRLYKTTCHLLKSQSKHLEVRSTSVVDISMEADGDIIISTEPGHELDKIYSVLRFVRSQGLACATRESANVLFRAIITLLGCARRDVASLARDILPVLFIGKYPAARLDYPLLWSCMQSLMTDPADAFYKAIGYSLWLRCAVDDQTPLPLWIGETSYWNLLSAGLEGGDSERRKQCIAILRRSVRVAVHDPLSRDSIRARKPEYGDVSTIQEQYERFCTIFETIIFNRYLNQVIECEADLDLMASSTSFVQPKWLYTLLSSALEAKMQDSTRKFLGGWIMRSGFQPDASNAFVVFLRQAFLPWATQGFLFTTSLRKVNGAQRCQHGDRLAEYVQRVLQLNTGTPVGNQLIEALLDSMIGRRGTNFAYARVYLLQGFGRAFEYTAGLVLETSHLEKLVDLSSWPALPEIARDYVNLRCWKLSSEAFLQAPESSPPSGKTGDAVRNWHQLSARCKDVATGTSFVTSFSSLESKTSQRDVTERKTAEKIEKLKAALQAGDRARSPASHIVTQLQDIWDDLESLEYPKQIMMAMPGLLLSRGLVQGALHDEQTASILPILFRRVCELSEHRVYMLSPICCAMRASAMSEPQTTRILPLAEIILGFAQGLPQTTVDLQLEDATSTLLSTISPELQAFGYEHYFGDRETVGIAALLDLISRLGSMETTMLQEVFDELLLLWSTQSVPPPTVSSWKNALQLQIMLLGCEQLLSTGHGSSRVVSVLENLHHILSIEALPRYRYLLEWMIAGVYVRHTEVQRGFLARLRTRDHHSNPKYLASLMKIGISLARVEASSEEFALELARAFIPLAASSKVVIRHEAQWQVPILMDLAQSKRWTGITNGAAYTALDEYIRSLERFEDPPHDRQLDRLDLAKDWNLTHLVEGPWFGLDDVETPLCRRADFIRLQELDASEGLNVPQSCIPLGDLVPFNAGNVIARNTPPIVLTPSPAATKSTEPRAMQTKGTAYLAHLSEHTQSQRNRVIVVASLVENPYNLGGLSRVSEVFGAAEMHLQSRSVLSNREFQNVSVSSHLHFPIHQLAADAMAVYLDEKKIEGWTVVGIEQTDRSVILGSEACRLPEYAILVVGSEKEGIPALVLSQCDILVEIQQHGVTRSLNVQTAAGIVLFEYARQHQRS